MRIGHLFDSKPMKIKFFRPGVLSLGLSFLAALPLQAAVLASTDFESYTAGSNLASGATPLSGPNNTGVVIGDDSVATPFGTGNKFLIMNGNIAQFTVAAVGVTPLSTFQFDFYEPTTQTGSLSFGLGVGNSGDLNATGGYAVWTINTGAIGVGSNTTLSSGSATSLVPGQAYRAIVLYNGSTEIQNVAIPTGGTASLGAEQTALFFYNPATGTYIDQGRYNSAKAGDPTEPNVFKFRAFSSSKNEVYIDNFVRQDVLTLAVPEPSGAMMGLVGLAGLLVRRRKDR